MPRKSIRALLGAVIFTLAGASAFAQTVIIAPKAPPPPRAEVLPPARPGFVWDPGHWHWVHGNYVWRPGHWEVIRAGFHWVPGHWIERGPNWRWVPGHWA